MRGMFKKFSKKFSHGGKEKEAKKEAAPTSSTTSATVPASASTSASAPNAASASPVTATGGSPPPVASALLSSATSPSPSSSPILPSSHLRLATTPTGSLPPSPPPPVSHSLPLDSSEGRPIGKKPISSLTRGPVASLPSGGERKEGEAGGVNGLANGVNGGDDADDDEDASSSSPHQLTRADLLKPIASLAEPSTPPQSSSPTSSPSAASSGVKQALFIHKLRLCCVTFDWSKDDPSAAASAMASPLAVNPAASKDARAKEAKRQQLLELLDYIGKSKSIYNDTTLHELMHMIAVNLFRALPPRTAELPSDEDDPVFEPSWAHLQIVYELFLRFIVNNDIDIRTLKKHIHAQFVLHLLELFDSEDHRERDYLKTILHRIYAKFMSLRAFIRKAINHVFYTFMSPAQHSHRKRPTAPTSLFCSISQLTSALVHLRCVPVVAMSRTATAASRSCWRSWVRSSTASRCR